MTKNNERFTNSGSPLSEVAATAYVKMKLSDGRQSIFSFDEFYMLGCRDESLESFIHCNPADLISGMEGVIQFIEQISASGQLDAEVWQEVSQQIDSLERSIKKLKG